MKLFLSEDELCELSGYQSRQYQAKWLRENLWPFEIDKDGRPKVLRATVLARLGAEMQTNKQPKLRFT
ncbi:DUF4224 domain-containing protein [Halothiobacillus sp.]|jgi:hypothetical protein|uniref:DUF4224 domain-containing protein n=1 Tax=Halothiobacillus sp. TaxID=1891311 RepID=UPI00262770B3|nr:DUF4224 domain-containing protein [Halothiobacillus sp.]MDD3576512.1 DUF4224 domain-containing protein [Halothiobacillus sp.]MDD4967731.1 DUF4224 domain-containing protein [Halothiobacillus sp.]